MKDTRTITAVVCVALILIGVVFAQNIVQRVVLDADEPTVKDYTPVSNSILWKDEEVKTEVRVVNGVENILLIDPSVRVLDTEDKTEEVAAEKARTYTDDDLYCLAVIIYVEAGADRICDECRRMVADVVLNRVNDWRFPNTIRKVLEEPGQYGTMSKTGVVWPERAYKQSEAKAVERAWKIAREVLEGNHTWIYGQSVVFQSEFPKLGTGIAVVHDGIYFNFG